MKKQLILAAILVSTFFTANAQTTVYTQDFEGNSADIFDQGWAVIGFQGNAENNGIYNTSASIQDIGITGKSIGFATFTMNGQTPQHISNADCAIISPELVLPQGTSLLKYRVGSVRVGANASSHYSVYIVTEEEMLPIANAAQFKALLNTKSAADSATISGHSSIISIDLSAYAGKTVFAVFRLHNSPSNTLLLFDDITVTNGILSLEEMESAQFAIYPNPAKDFVNVEGKGSIIENISFTDASGKLVASSNFDGTAMANVDVSALTNGLYIMTVKSDKGIVNRKIMKS